MPQNTPNFNIPYPLGTDPALVSSDMQAIATQTDTAIKEYIDVAVAAASAGNIVRVTTTTYTAANGDFIIADCPASMLVTFPLGQEGDFIRIVNFGNGVVSVESAAQMNGDTVILQNKGMLAVHKDDAWWCLPLSSSPSVPQPEGWVRPSDWLDLPELIQGDEVVYAIARIYPDKDNDFTFLLAGECLVDWGDGTTSTSVVGEECSHTYTYSSIPSATMTTGGFRQAIIEIRPVAPATLDWFSPAGINDRNTGFFAEIKITSPNLSSINYQRENAFANTISLILKHPNLITYLPYISDNYSSTELENVELDIEGVNDLDYRLSYTASLKRLILNTSPTLTNLRGLVYLTNIKELAVSDISNVTSTSDMFSWSNTNNQTISSIVIGPSVTNASYMYYAVSKVTQIPPHDTSGIANANYMFGGMSALTSIPALDFSSAVSAEGLCRMCSNLKSSGIYGIRASHSYQDCNLSASALDTIYTNLGTPTEVNVIGVTYPTNPSWAVIFELDAPLDIGSSFYNYMTFKDFSDPAFNGSKYIYYNYNGDPTMLQTDQYYFGSGSEIIPTTLGKVTFGGALNVTGNPGLTGDDPSIATAKGWVVTG